MINSLQIKDFSESDYFSYEALCCLWEDENVSLIIDFGEEANKSDMLLKYIDKIKQCCDNINLI